MRPNVLIALSVGSTLALAGLALAQQPPPSPAATGPLADYGPPITNEQAEATVRRYLDLVANGTAAEIVELYAGDAVLEDPVGGTPLVGRENIRAFYATLEAFTVTTELQTIRTCGGEAAFQFHIETDTGAGVAVLEPLENMKFTEDGLISNMRAWWGDSDMTFS